MLHARARRAARRYGSPALILVDYLQLMRCEGQENRANGIAEISLAQGARQRDEVPYNGAFPAQPGNGVQAEQASWPCHLRESGAIEQDADVIMFLYPAEYYHSETEFKGIAELSVGKHRNGEVGMVRAAFFAKQTRFENLSTQAWR